MTRTAYHRYCLSLWLALAVFVQALIPAGFMPNLGGDNGQTPLVICTAQGAETLTPNTEPSSPTHEADSVCAYALMGQSPVLPDPIVVAAPQPTHMHSAYGLVRHNPPLRAWVQPYAPQAPPAPL
mgnify:CR=1 FL=1